MATDIATLGIKIEAKDIKKAVKELDRLESQSKNSEKSNKRLGTSFGALIAKVGGVTAAVLAFKKSITSLREFQDLSASLKTATGSADAATLAMENLEQLSMTLPDNVNDVVRAFVQLTNLGLKPSEEAIVSYSNTASALGKDLMQFVEAVADATVGEFERLKEFGIKASAQGDEVAFRFRGNTTVIKNDAASIESYLQAIGNNEFAGAAAERASQLTGAISNAEAALDRFWRSLSDNEAIGGTFTEFLRLATTSLTNWADTLNTPEITTLQEGIADSAKRLSELRMELQEAEDGGGLMGAIFGRDPEGIKAEMERIYTEAAQFQERLREINESYTIPTDDKVTAAIEEQQAIQDAELNQINLGNSLKLLHEQQAADDRIALAQLEADAKRQITKDFFGNLSVLMTAESKRLFNIGKVAAIASAIINTSEAVTKTMASVPYPWNIPLATAQGLAGAVQIQNIRNQQHGGGSGSVPAPGGGAGATVPSLPDYASPQTTQPQGGSFQLIIQGDFVGNDENIDRLVDGLQDRIDNRDLVLIRPDSRQALELTT